uniref:Zinc finger and BTB domain containing 12, tandem duplicate 2 n=1 Tax=Tetraodon nigroviridis TaxID=99883 RepID=H3CE02_TETNG
METLHFQLPGHGDTTLKHMNSLRCSQHFCDITIVASNKQTFKGHKVVLAACSPFLRDQFLLNPSSNLQVSVLYSSTVVCDLLKSCYTGILQFNSEEIVNYLTAASYLQMDFIVERCRGALKKILELKNPSLSKPLTVSQRSDSVTSAPPATHKHSPVQPRSPDLHSADDSFTNPAFFLQINVSDDGEETHQEDYDKFNICISKEAANGNNEERGPPSDVPHDAFCPETDGIVIGESDYNLILADDEIANGRVRGTGKGFMSIDLPQLDKALGDSEGEKASSTSASSLTQYGMEESSSGTHEGSSGLAANEGVDESVAVVGSTSSVAGPVICEQCGMTFPSVHTLAVHSSATHPFYSCPCCGKHFHHSASLTRHMAVHQGSGKSHQCPLCYKTFTQKSTLIDHMNLHSGERPHHCAYCHARFAHKPALRRHLKELHGKTTAQNFLYEQQEQLNVIVI